VQRGTIIVDTFIGKMPYNCTVQDASANMLVIPLHPSAWTTLLSLASCMHVLFAISILAFLTLLWACFAIALHVRRTRRRERTTFRSGQP